MQKKPFGQIPSAARFIGGAFGLIFFGIGLTVIGFMWLGDDGFGSPPLFFKVFATFIALGFVAMGGTLAASAFFGGGGFADGHAALMQDALRHAPSQATTPPTAPASPAPRGAANYACPHCGGALGEKADVSPMGDAKCTFCGRWFNVHGRN